jgi:hypothetical protein
MLRGFACPKGLGNVPFAYCEDDCREANGDRCHPLPLLKNLMSQREVVPGTFSVTQLNKAVNQLMLERTTDYYVKPMSMMNMAFGTAVHAILENGYNAMSQGEEKDSMIVEQKMSTLIETPHGMATLSGTPDVVYPDRIDDWKTGAAFSMGKWREAAKDGDAWGEDNFIQLNVYRAMWYPHVSRLRLVGIAKDWTARMGGEMVQYVEVPVADAAFVREWVTRRVSALMEAEVTGKWAECSAKDRAKYGGKICDSYCSVRQNCPQMGGQ